MLEYIREPTMVQKHVAEWIGRWTRASDKIKRSGVRSIPTDGHHLEFIEVSGKLLIPYCLWIPSSDGYIVNENYDWEINLSAYLYDRRAVFSQGRWDCSSGVCPIPGNVSHLKLCTFTFTNTHFVLSCYILNVIFFLLFAPLSYLTNHIFCCFHHSENWLPFFTHPTSWVCCW